MIAARSRRSAAQIRAEILLEHAHARIELLELARYSPIAWAALEALAFVFCLEDPAEELRRLYLAAALLEAALTWFNYRRAERERWLGRYWNAPPL